MIWSNSVKTIEWIKTLVDISKFYDMNPYENRELHNLIYIYLHCNLEMITYLYENNIIKFVVNEGMYFGASKNRDNNVIVYLYNIFGYDSIKPFISDGLIDNLTRKNNPFIFTLIENDIGLFENIFMSICKYCQIDIISRLGRKYSDKLNSEFINMVFKEFISTRFGWGGITFGNFSYNDYLVMKYLMSKGAICDVKSLDKRIIDFIERYDIIYYEPEIMKIQKWWKKYYYMPGNKGYMKLFDSFNQKLLALET